MVDCLLLSAYPVDAIFEVKARSHAAINSYWVALSVPEQTGHLMRSELIGPNGAHLAQMATGADLVIGGLDRQAPDLQVALTLARPWRASALAGEIYSSRQVNDQRSTDRTSL